MSRVLGVGSNVYKTGRINSNGNGNGKAHVCPQCGQFLAEYNEEAYAHEQLDGIKIRFCYIHLAALSRSPETVIPSLPCGMKQNFTLENFLKEVNINLFYEKSAKRRKKTIEVITNSLKKLKLDDLASSWQGL